MSYTSPSTLTTGQRYYWHVMASKNGLLTKSPQYWFKVDTSVQTATQPVISNVSISSSIISGIAIDPDTTGENPWVVAWIDGAYGNGVFISGFKANSSTGVFTIPIPNQYQDNSLHTVFLYAVDTEGVTAHGQANTSFTWNNDTIVFPDAIDPADDSNVDSVYNGGLKGVFNVDQNGAATYTIPIHVSPGINGLQPKLALHYNSLSRHNGYVGYGWSLSGLSAIHRCRPTFVRDGYVDGINNGDDYKFCLDGQRIAAFGANEKVPTRFEVSGRDGTVRYYGSRRGANSKQLSGGSAYSYHLDKVKDLAGNYSEYNYSYNTASGEHYIDSIEYGINDAAGTRFSSDRTISFFYSARDDDQVRYVAGAKQAKTKVLTSIVQGQRAYKLVYEPWDGVNYAEALKTSRLKQVYPCLAISTCTPVEFDWTVINEDSYVSDYAALETGGHSESERAAMNRSTGNPKVHDFFNDKFYDSIDTNDCEVPLTCNIYILEIERQL